MKKMNRSLSFAVMGLVALGIYTLIQNDPNTPITLKLSLGTLATFLFLLSIVGYLRRPKQPKK